MNENRRNGCLVFLWILVAFLAGFSLALRINPNRLSKRGNDQALPIISRAAISKNVFFILNLF